MAVEMSKWKYHQKNMFAFLLQRRPWLYLRYIFLCFQADRRESRQTDGALYSALKELWFFFFEGQAFLPYREVFVRNFNSKVLTWQHVVLYSDGDMDHFFPGSSKWPWPNDKQQLGSWINPSMVHVRIFDHFITNTQRTHANSLDSSSLVFFNHYATHSWFSQNALFVSVKISTVYIYLLTYLTVKILACRSLVNIGGPWNGNRLQNGMKGELSS